MTSRIARIEGYASIFNVRDMNGDIVAPGAFSRSLRKRGPDRVRMLYQHAVEAPLGRWTRLREDAKGLYAVGELILETERARDIAALIEGGALDGLSIGFQTVKARKEQSARVILEADLWEISVVTFPMAEGARIAALTYPDESLAATLKSAAKILNDDCRASPLPWERPKPCPRKVSGEGTAFSNCRKASLNLARETPHPKLLRSFDLSQGRGEQPQFRNTKPSAN